MIFVYFPAEFEWEALARNYVRRVKGLVRKDEDLARQLELDQQRAIKESNEALVGVPVQFDLREYQESLKEKFGSLSLDSLDTTGAAYDSLRLWKIFVARMCGSVRSLRRSYMSCRRSGCWSCRRRGRLIRCCR